MISEEFVAAVGHDLAEAGVHLEPGLAVGTEFVSDLIPFPVPVRLVESEILEAAAIYTFDLLTQNPDRSATNPNCGRSGQRIALYDFETAFSFRFALARGDGWRVAGLPFPQRHLLHKCVSRVDVDWPAVFAKFRTVPFSSLADACSTIPEAWASVGQEVQAHLASVYDHWSEFEQEITKSLESSS